MAMSSDAASRNVVVLAPMPLEMDAIVKAFGLTPTEPDGSKTGPHTGKVGDADVTAIHIGMGPPLTRAAVSRLLDPDSPDHVHVDHMMIAGICGGLDPDLPVGTLVNPEVIIHHASGATFRHTPPGGDPMRGKLITTEGVTLNTALSRRFFEDGCLGVDMESSAVAEVCEKYGCPWSVYRCIGDRWMDGLLDQRLLDATNPDGSGNMDEINRLLAAEPQLAKNLEQLSHDSTLAARLAAEAAVRGCLALGV
jgi:nucleoside phosphorylase